MSPSAITISASSRPQFQKVGLWCQRFLIAPVLRSTNHNPRELGLISWYVFFPQVDLHRFLLPRYETVCKEKKETLVFRNSLLSTHLFSHIMLAQVTGINDIASQRASQLKNEQWIRNLKLEQERFSSKPPKPSCAWC